MNGDGLRELVVIQRDDTGESYSRASYYTYQDGMLVMTSGGRPVGQCERCDLGAYWSAGRANACYLCHLGTVKEGRSPISWPIKMEAWSTSPLTADSGISNYTLRSYTGVSVTDINNDGVLEVPVALALPSVRASSETTHWIIYWRQVLRTLPGPCYRGLYHLPLH